MPRRKRKGTGSSKDSRISYQRCPELRPIPSQTCFSLHKRRIGSLELMRETLERCRVKRCWAGGPLGWWTRSDAVALWGGTHLDDWSCVPIWDKGKGEETKNRCKGKRGLQREVALHAGCHVKRKQRERGAPSKKRKCPFLLDAALPSLDSFRGFGLSLDMSPSAGLPFGIKLIFKIQVARRAHAESISLLFFNSLSRSI